MRSGLEKGLEDVFSETELEALGLIRADGYFIRDYEFYKSADEKMIYFFLKRENLIVGNFQEDALLDGLEDGLEEKQKKHEYVLKHVLTIK